MKISIEISMYPLEQNYIPPIQSFIDELNTHPEIKVKTNSMSTQVFGEYDDIMEAIKTSTLNAFGASNKVVMVMKMINSDLDYEYGEWINESMN